MDIRISDFGFRILDLGLAKKRAFAANTGTLIVGFVSRRLVYLDYRAKGLTGDESMVSNQ